MEITKKELLEHCASATKELTEEMSGLERHGRVALILTVVAFTSILSNRIFPEEKKGE